MPQLMARPCLRMFHVDQSFNQAGRVDLQKFRMLLEFNGLQALHDSFQRVCTQIESEELPHPQLSGSAGKQDLLVRTCTSLLMRVRTCLRVQAYSNLGVTEVTRQYV